MLLYRVAPILGSADPGEPGHLSFVPLQSHRGRWDNPDLYTTWYFGESPVAAVAESFASLSRWTADMFDYPALPGARRTLLTAHVDETVSLLDLDDAQTLLDWRLRPTQVVTRNRTATQECARRFHLDSHRDGTAKWAGLRWWSIHRPQWGLVALWSPPGQPLDLPLTVEEEPLSLAHPAVVEAGRTLAKHIEPSS